MKYIYISTYTKIWIAHVSKVYIYIRSDMYICISKNIPQIYMCLCINISLWLCWWTYGRVLKLVQRRGQITEVGIFREYRLHLTPKVPPTKATVESSFDKSLNFWVGETFRGYNYTICIYIYISGSVPSLHSNVLKHQHIQIYKLTWEHIKQHEETNLWEIALKSLAGAVCCPDVPCHLAGYLRNQALWVQSW